MSESRHTEKDPVVLTPEQAAAKLKDLGYEGIDVSNFPAHYIQALHVIANADSPLSLTETIRERQRLDPNRKNMKEIKGLLSLGKKNSNENPLPFGTQRKVK